MSRASWASSALLLAVLALGASACGGTGSAAADRGDCAGRLLTKADAAVVARAYEQGKLGTQREVERALGGTVAAGRHFFTSTGKLKRPYDELTSDQDIGEFNAWMHENSRVLGATLAEQHQAEKRARAQAKRVC
jgi:hypothetical protein